VRITDIKTFLMQAQFPPDDAYATAHRTDAAKQESSTSATRNWLFLKVYTDAGVTGVGECSGWPRVVERAVHDLTPLLIGEDPGDIARLWQKSFSAMMAHGMTGVVGAGALSGIDMALWDIKGKALGTPVWNLLQHARGCQESQGSRHQGDQDRRGRGHRREGRWDPPCSRR
jgi:galactonate dehydratase